MIYTDETMRTALREAFDRGYANGLRVGYTKGRLDEMKGLEYDAEVSVSDSEPRPETAECGGSAETN